MMEDRKVQTKHQVESGASILKHFHALAQAGSLPEADAKSRAVVEEMLCDELQHARSALDAGGFDFPAPIKLAMRLASRVMTHSSYHL